MVTLYTWDPPKPEWALEHRFSPDMGHSALKVTDDNGVPRAYASFWPERESMIGRIRDLWVERLARHPKSYVQEIDPDQGFMQRPADHADAVDGLAEDLVVEIWEMLRDGGYDVRTWNCSNVCKLLILTGMDPRHHESMQQAMVCSPADLLSIAGPDDLFSKLRYLSTSPFIDCRPDDVRRAAQAYRGVCMARQ